ncbi:MAG TPA: [LysW]-aminoadipate kinase [Anaerolineales bacterium]|nr:[LysW]-aminoadipate kinase [Anaerolineales bacterium]
MSNLISPIVIKIGGADGVPIEPTCADIAAQVQAGKPVVVVHGGSGLANSLGEQIGHPPRFVTSESGHTSRYTDARTLEIFLMATGLLNRQIVAQLQGLGCNAFGLSGLDGKTLQARRKEMLRIVENGKRKVLRDDFTGTIEQVAADGLSLLLSAGFTPVVAPLAISQLNEPLNVDGDRAAAAIAAALHAQTLVLLTNVTGLYRNFPDEASLIASLPASKLPEALEQYAQGRMKRKVLAAQEALQGGVAQVVISSARVPNPLSHALNGGGTQISR